MKLVQSVVRWAYKYVKKKFGQGREIYLRLFQNLAIVSHLDYV